jgi:hypothetical protein
MAALEWVGFVEFRLFIEIETRLRNNNSALVVDMEFVENRITRAQQKILSRDNLLYAKHFFRKWTNTIKILKLIILSK